MTLALLASWMLRASVLMLVALAVTRMTRRPAAWRHGVLATATWAALLLPALSMVIPAWPLVPTVALPMRHGAPAAAHGIAVETTFVLPVAPALAVGTTGPARLTPAVGLATILVGGMLLRFVFVSASLVRLRRLGRSARPVMAAVWLDELALATRRDSRLAQVRLLRGNRHTPVVTWGWRRPVILVPDGAESWCPDRIRVVLAHECAHVARGDWLTQLAAEGLRTLWWFNPLAWTVASQVRFESERACDDLVVAGGVDPADYAGHLVDLVRTQPHWFRAATSMAHPSTLERRIAAMLDRTLAHDPMSRVARLGVTLCGLGLTVFVASLTGQTSFATLNGVVLDPLGGTIPKVTLKVTHADSGARHEVSSADTGRFEFVGLTAGNYTLEASVPGFRPFSVPLQLAAGGTVSRSVALEIGQLQETITVRDSRADAPRLAGSGSPRPQPACTTAPNSGGLRPPTKTRDVRPDYPGAHHSSGTEAVVTLRATIGTDGTVGTVDTVEAPAIEFAEAAKDAVRQWRFTPTLLNCVPVEVEMNVAVRFTP